MLLHLQKNGRDSERYWSRKYISGALERMSDCYVIKVVENGEIELFRNATVLTNDAEKQKGYSSEIVMNCFGFNRHDDTTN